MPVNKALWKRLEYTPHPRQAEVHASKARFKVVCAGRRWGKSQSAAREAEIDLLNPQKKGRIWIVAPQYDIGEKEFRYIWFDIVVKLGLGPRLKKKAYNVRTGEMYIEMPWGTRLEVKSADHPDSLVGEGLIGVIFSEAAKQGEIIWDKYISPALADYRGWAIFPSTPEGYNWFYKLYQLGQDPTAPEWESWQCPSWDNPYIYPGGFDDTEIQRQLRSPDDPWFWQEIGAKFTSVVGLVYPEWDRKVHVKPWEYNPSIPNFLFYDPGYTNPFAVYDAQITSTDEIHVWREYYHRQKRADVVVRELLARPQPEGYKIECCYGDSADPGVVDLFTEKLGPTISMDDAKDWITGIRLVKRFLRSEDGQPMLFVDPSCEMLCEEFETHKTRQPPRGRPFENPKEEPEKKNDHGLDAIRYGLMHKFHLGADSHLAEVYDGDDRKMRGMFTWSREDAVTTAGGIW